MSSSLNVNHRLWSTPRFAYRFISLVSIFWIVFSIHALFGSKIFSTGNSSFCSIEEGTYSLFVVLYSIIINYLLSPILMIIFGLLTIINVRQTQQRVRGRVLNGALQRKDHYLLHMLLFQVLTSVIFTIPMAAYQVSTILACHTIVIEENVLDLFDDISRLAEESYLEKLGWIDFPCCFHDFFHSLLCGFLHLYSNRQDISKRIPTSYHSQLSSIYPA